MPEVALPDVTLAYDQVGDGPDLVWICGGDMRGKDWHHYQVPAFPDFRNLTYDPRGAGSTVSKTPPPWSMELMASDCIRLIEAVCRPPVCLAGLSMGSAITQQVALDRPDLVRCAIAMGTYGRSEGWVRYFMEADMNFRRENGWLSPEFAAAHYLVLSYPSKALGDQEFLERTIPLIMEMYGHRNPDDLIGQWDACNDFESLSRLPDCEVPLHVIGFSEDVQTPIRYGMAVAAAAPSGQFHLLEGLGHMSLLGHKPEPVNWLIREILQRYT